MAPPNPLPKYVYKIIPSAPPDPIPEAYPLSDLDKQDGFVHLSTSWQIPITAGLFFADHPSIWVIKLRLARLAPDTTWDDVPGTSGCPHLHGNFGRPDVEGVARFDHPEAEGDGSWPEALADAGGEGGFLE